MLEMPADLLAAARSAKGWMPEDEGQLLFRTAQIALDRGPVLEVGSYCGKSAIYLGAAAQVRDSEGDVVFTVDHHRGSQEIQPGWEHHDPDLIDPRSGKMDSLPFLRRTLTDAGLDDRVVAIVGESASVATHWRTPLGMVFIDGGHSDEPAQADYTGWARWLVTGGLLAVHDVFEHPEDGGQAPYRVISRALDTGDFEAVETCESLRVLRRVSADAGDLVR